MKRLLLILALMLATAPAIAQNKPLPTDSIYHLDVQFTDQAGHTQPLAARRGRPQLVTMLYTSCQMVCPLIIDSLRQTWKTLDAGDRSRIDLLAVSFDPERDTVAALRAYAAKRQLVAPPWTLARTKAGDVRQLSGVLGLQYRQLPDGEFNHSSELILLDAEGRIVARTTRMGRADPGMVAAIRQTLAGKQR
ncbi:MAG: SCO family protein [Rhodanobacter sp.]|nr:MAG: SCO family protein [Rhodanobacter sp.]TAM12030.1 MAG: SCO family protein [Rhodanobacter sp.]TAM34629.1 MAG: SCO family protein [Rhodanobacter sp.]